MRVIKFSFPFPKLFYKGQLIQQAKLLDVHEVELSNLSAELLDYDTATGAYQLPKSGTYLMLIFLKPGGLDLFTTLRRSTPEKLRYYKSLIGEIMAVDVAQSSVSV